MRYPSRFVLVNSQGINPCAHQVLLADPRCHELLSELLLPHVQRYVAEGDALPPLDLAKCASIHQVGAHTCSWPCMGRAY